MEAIRDHYFQVPEVTRAATRQRRLTYTVHGKTVTESLLDQAATRKAEREIACEISMKPDLLLIQNEPEGI